MRRLIGVAAFVGGMLLVAVPRWVLPACEYEGFAPMRCSQTARAAMVAGALLAVSGVAALLAKGARTTAAAGVLAAVLSAVSFVLPDAIGYCRGTRMPCNYGMVPGIRFIAAASGLVLVAGLVGMARRARRAREAP